MAGEVLTQGIEQRLWDEQERTFSYGLTEEGRRLTAPALWMTLMPFWLYDRFDERLPDTLSYLRKRLYDHDPRIPGTYWFYDYSPMLSGQVPLENRYSGIGVAIGGLPVLIHALLKAGDYDHAREQLGVIIRYTNPENHLICEHINTLHPGKIGDYGTYPHPYYYVDSGNLLHLSFFLTLMARWEPAVLRRAARAQGAT